MDGSAVQAIPNISAAEFVYHDGYVYYANRADQVTYSAYSEPDDSYFDVEYLRLYRARMDGTGIERLSEGGVRGLCSQGKEPDTPAACRSAAAVVTYEEAELETDDISGPYTSSDLGGLETGGFCVIIIDGQPFYGIHAPVLLNGFWEMKELADPITSMPGIPLIEYVNVPELTSFAMNFETDSPVSVSVRHDGEAGGMPVTVTDPKIIREVFLRITLNGKCSGAL